MNIRYLLLAAWISANLFCADATAAEKIRDDFAEVELILQHPSIKPDSNSAIQIKFNLAKDWHFYADEKNAPQGTSLKITAQGQNIIFFEPIFPKSQIHFDPITNQKVAVYSGQFSIFVPFKADINAQNTEIKVVIEALSCSQQLCRRAYYELSKAIEISKQAETESSAFEIMERTPTTKVGANYVLILAVIAGLLLNVMPCVWPILPIIVMRLIQQAQKSKIKSIIAGFAFAAGIILFFAALAAVSAVLKAGFGIIFQWGDQFRNQAFVISMALLMVVLAMYMFGVFTFNLSISASSGTKQQKGGLISSIGMGFLAAVLSTPCSFAILAFVLAWAQTQTILLATITFLLIGAGMSIPYVILTCVPGLLNSIPKPGRWMEIFKHATGFILLAIGVKLLEAVQSEKIINVLYYAIVLAVCVWMWGFWVSENGSKAKKWLIRLAAIIIAIYFGFLLLAEPKKEIIDWQPYDAELIVSAKQAQRPVLIKFTADWCLSCKVLDKTVYSSNEIAGLIKQKGVLAIKADTTRFDYPASKALKEIYNEPAIPVTVLLLPDSDTPIKLAGNLIGKKLAEYLKKLPDKIQ
jgi:thiol:disulfide interchange protein